MKGVSARYLTYPGRSGEYEVLKIGAGVPTVEHIVPPAGELYAFDVTKWSTGIEVSVSPTGRSVQVFVNGTKVAT